MTWITFLLLSVVTILEKCVGFPADLAGLKELSQDEIDRLENLGPQEQPEFLSGQFQGDIVLTEKQVKEIDVTDRTGLIDINYKWPGSIVYYKIKTNDFSKYQLEDIQYALHDIAYQTCVRFVERTTQKDYILVTGDNTGCWSNVGRIGGQQQVNLQPLQCVWKGTIIHEFLHSLGFHHMQSATERDYYVTINWDNINPKYTSAFRSLPWNEISQFGVPYDLSSIMHYDSYAFSKNGKPTILAINGDVIKRHDRLSAWDVNRINNKYCD